MNWLLLFVQVAIGLEFLAPDRHLLIFVTSSLGATLQALKAIRVEPAAAIRKFA